MRKCLSTILIITDIPPAVGHVCSIQMLPVRIFITEGQTIFHKTVTVPAGETFDASQTITKGLEYNDLLMTGGGHRTIRWTVSAAAVPAGADGTASPPVHEFVVPLLEADGEE